MVRAASKVEDMLMRLLKRAVALAFILAAAPLTTAAEAPPDWTLTTAEHPIAPGSIVLETIWTLPRPPGGAYDTIRVHRYRSTEDESRATLLYLPGTNMNGAAALTDELHNLWVLFAGHRVEVFTLDYRTHAIPPETDIKTLTDLHGWTTALFVDDVAAAAALARQETGRAKLYVAGFSRGVMLAYAYAGLEPDKVAGLVVLDGSFKRAAPDPDFDPAAALAKLEASGIWASDVGGKRGWMARQAMMVAAADNPDGPATDPKFKTVGEQLTYVLQNAWGPGGLANPEGGVSKPQILATLMRDYDRYYPTIQDIDGKTMAQVADDPTTPLDDRWGEMTVPIIAFSSTGMGQAWQDNVRFSAERSGSPDVTVHALPGYGHLDVLVAEHAVGDVYAPVLGWILVHAAADR